MFNIIYTPYITDQRFELCWNRTPVAEYDASAWEREEAEEIATMLNYKIKAGEPLARKGWKLLSMQSLPQEARLMFFGLWTYNI